MNSCLPTDVNFNQTIWKTHRNRESLFVLLIPSVHVSMLSLVLEEDMLKGKAPKAILGDMKT